jgi:hypothetical protein
VRTGLSSGTRDYLAELLTALDRDLLVLVKLRHYQERQHYESTDHEPSDPFTYSFSLLSISRDLRVERVVPTQHDYDLIEALGEHASYDFGNRLQALSAARATERST